MTSSADDIAEYLEDQSIGTVGTNVFVGKMPPTPDLAMALFNYAGQPPDKVADDYETQGLQIKIRGATLTAGWDAAWVKANAIFEALHGLTNATIETKAYHYIFATGSPAQMGFDELERPLFVINFMVIKAFD